jgi:OFA family oxalate/formate antiporter-like MFS transporter
MWLTGDMAERMALRLAHQIKSLFRNFAAWVNVPALVPSLVARPARPLPSRFGDQPFMAALNSRWGQLILGIVCMVMIANLQYGWTLFVLPIDQAHHWGTAAIQVAFTIFVIGETWLLPLAGYVIDRIGPRLTVSAGGVLIGASWVMNGMADTLTLLYVAAGIGGIGAGFIYGATVGNAIKWFPDRRGLAAGLTAAGFGAGSAVTVVPISRMIASSGYQSTFLAFGLAQGVIVAVVGLMLRAPPGHGADPATSLSPSGLTAMRASRLHDITRDYSPGQTAREPVFWVMYLMFVLVGAGGLIATAQLSVIATDFGVARAPVTLAFITMPALTFALSLDRVLNGFTRPFFGWVSDRIGREETMFVAFLLEGLGIFALIGFATTPLAFVVLSGLVFFAWGEIYSLFPATCGDTFGKRYAATNYGMLYTAKGTASLLVPLGSLLRAATGSWLAVLTAAAVVNLLAAFLALFVLRPMRRRFIRRSMEARAAERIAAAEARLGRHGGLVAD